MSNDASRCEGKEEEEQRRGNDESQWMSEARCVVPEGTGRPLLPYVAARRRPRL